MADILNAVSYRSLTKVRYIVQWYISWSIWHFTNWHWQLRAIHLTRLFHFTRVSTNLTFQFKTHFNLWPIQYADTMATEEQLDRQYYTSEWDRWCFLSVQDRIFNFHMPLHHKEQHRLNVSHTIEDYRSYFRQPWKTSLSSFNKESSAYPLEQQGHTIWKDI